MAFLFNMICLTFHITAILLLPRPSKATQEKLHFSNSNFNDLVFTQHVLFESAVRSKLNCGYLCSIHAECVTFTSNGVSRPGLCRGHSSVMTVDNDQSPSLGSKTFVLRAISSTGNRRRISSTTSTTIITSAGTTTVTTVGTVTSTTDGTTAKPSAPIPIVTTTESTTGLTTSTTTDQTTGLQTTTSAPIPVVTTTESTTSLTTSTTDQTTGLQTTTSAPIPVVTTESTTSLTTSTTDQTTGLQTTTAAGNLPCLSEAPYVPGADLLDVNTTTVSYQCTGVLTNGPATVGCLPDGTWDTPTFHCVDCAVSGGISVFGNTGTLLSPGYPGAYSPSTECVYTITLEQAGPQTVTVDIEKNIEFHVVCSFDYIRFNGGSKLCGSNPMTLTLDVVGDTWTMMFRTDPQVVKERGFRVTYYVNQ